MRRFRLAVARVVAWSLALVAVVPCLGQIGNPDEYNLRLTGHPASTPPPNWQTELRSVNDFNRGCGWANHPSLGSRPMWWDVESNNSVPQLLPLTNGFDNGRARAIGDDQTIVGEQWNSSAPLDVLATVWRWNGSAYVPVVLSAVRSLATSYVDDGFIIWVTTPNGPTSFPLPFANVADNGSVAVGATAALRRPNDADVTLARPTGTATGTLVTATGGARLTNGNVLVVGAFIEPGSRWRACSWEVGPLDTSVSGSPLSQTLPNPGDVLALDTNSRGEVVGVDTTFAGGVPRAFFWRPTSGGTVSDLSNLRNTPGTSAVAWAINDAGRIVGQSDANEPSGGTRSRPFRVDLDANRVPGPMSQLNPALQPDSAFGYGSTNRPARIRAAYDVNNLDDPGRRQPVIPSVALLGQGPSGGEAVVARAREDGNTGLAIGGVRAAREGNEVVLDFDTRYQAYFGSGSAPDRQAEQQSGLLLVLDGVTQSPDSLAGQSSIPVTLLAGQAAVQLRIVPAFADAGKVLRFLPTLALAYVGITEGGNVSIPPFTPVVAFPSGTVSVKFGQLLQIAADVTTVDFTGATVPLDGAEVDFELFNPLNGLTVPIGTTATVANGQAQLNAPVPPTIGVGPNVQLRAIVREKSLAAPKWISASGSKTIEIRADATVSVSSHTVPAGTVIELVATATTTVGGTPIAGRVLTFRDMFRGEDIGTATTDLAGTARLTYLVPGSPAVVQRPIRVRLPDEQLYPGPVDGFGTVSVVDGSSTAWTVPNFVIGAAGAFQEDNSNVWRTEYRNVSTPAGKFELAGTIGEWLVVRFDPGGSQGNEADSESDGATAVVANGFWRTVILGPFAIVLPPPDGNQIASPGPPRKGPNRRPDKSPRQRTTSP